MVRFTALVLTVLTGFSGLVYEVAWQKYLATLLGSHSEAAAATLGLFLGGLSAGYALFGVATRRRVARAERTGRSPRLLAFYGTVEAGIGVFALAFHGLFLAVRELSFRIPHGAGGAGFAIDVALSALLVLPPTVLMGGTIPILSQALARGLADATRFHAFVYAFNTAGAFLGALAAGFVLVPVLGLQATVAWMGGVNLVAGGTFLALDLLRPGRTARAAAGPAPGAAERAAREGAPAGFALWALVALLQGFGMMCVQTVLIRVGGLTFGASQFAFSMVVAAFVLCIALGSLAVSALPRIRPAHLVGTQWLLVLWLFALYFGLPDAPYWAHALRIRFPNDDAAFLPYYLAAFGAALALLAVPIGLSGATIPLLFHHLRREVGDLGAVAGRLYSWNTLGSLSGALLGGYVLLFWLDLNQVWRVAIFALALAAACVTARVGRLRPALAAFVAAAAAVALSVLPAWDPDRLASGAFRVRRDLPESHAGPAAFYAAANAGTRLVFYDDDPTTTVTVRDVATPGGGVVRGIFTNGKSDGAVPIDYPTMGLAALVPALLAERCERAFVIGWGTGVSAGELASLEGTREVVVGEISRGVIAAAPLFDAGNQGASRAPKVRVALGDAYRALLRSEGRWDVIVSEPSNPWVAGIEMLFSEEFLSAARARLSAGGVYAQWFHLYETDPETVALVLRTYRQVFDAIAVWYGLGSDLLILGFAGPLPEGVDLERLESRAARPDFAAALRRSGVASLPALLAHELLPLGVANAARMTGDVHTLLHPLLSYRAARAFFRVAQGALPPTFAPPAAALGRSRSLVAQLAARSGGTLPDAARAQLTTELCKHRRAECAAFLARWWHDAPDSPALAAALASSHADRALVAHLAQFFDAAAGDGARPAASGAAPAVLDPGRAGEITDLFAAHYFHAAPFDPDVVRDAWRRCAGAGPDDAGCAAGRARADGLVGAATATAGGME